MSVMCARWLPLLLGLTLLPLASRGEDLLDAYRQAIANDPVLSSAKTSRRRVRPCCHNCR